MILGELIAMALVINLPRPTIAWAGDSEPLTEVSWDDLERHGLDSAEATRMSLR